MRFADAMCSQPAPYSAMYTPILDGPKPRHRAWYFSGPNEQPTGRKYYFHSRTVRSERGSRTSGRGETLNQHIKPIGSNSVFTFRVHFDSLDTFELQLLCYALVLESTMRHKIGYAKPAGLGSIEIAISRIVTFDMEQRYSFPSQLQGRTIYEGSAASAYLAGQTARFTTDQTSVTLNDLRRIWQWPPPDGVEYGYPTRKWFEENPTAPISATVDDPTQR